MPTVSVANFENDDLLSPRLLSFMANNDQVSLGYDGSIGNGNKYTTCGNFGLQSGVLIESDAGLSNPARSPLHRNGSTSTIVSLQDRMLNGSPSDIFVSNNTGFMSGSCTPPPIHPVSSVSSNFLPVRNHIGPPPYSAITSPCLSSKLNPGANVQLLGLNNGNSTDCHSLQNSPFYNHYPVSGNLQNQIHRQITGLGPNPLGAVLPNGVGTGLQNVAGPRNGIYQDTSLSVNSTVRPPALSNSGCPQRELFPSQTQIGGCSIFGSGLRMQERLHYYALAQKHGYIVGAELERVKENSCRSTSQSYGRIAAHFRHRYGETEAKTKAAYLQIGVRVPSKDHVSEIVGKGGQKIKLIREETGALITTPGEHEEHVFIIEAPPEIAMRVAHHITTRAQEITQSKLAAGERRRGSTSSQPSGGLGDNGLSSAVFHINGSGTTSAINLTTPNGGPLMSHSASNSPLHPTVSLMPATMNGTIGGSSSNGVNLRTPNCGSVFSCNLSSLPSSPCGSFSNGGMNNGTHSVLTNSTMSGALFQTNPSGSRVLLARSRISVPQELVGKIIGTQGSIITTIQKDTGTEIKSPPKEAARGPNATSEFEISAYQGLGLNSNQAAECRVQQAKQLIGHLVMRQVERRVSDELDEVASSLSSDEQRMNGGSTSKSLNGWMWPDVAQMDYQEAREVLDRILAESKNKTRRAKELAAAAAAGSASASTSNGHNLANNLAGSVLSSVPTVQSNIGGLLGQDQRQMHFHSQLVGPTGLFVDSSDSSENHSDLARDLTRQLGDSPVSNLFGTQSGHYTNRSPSVALVEDIQHGGSCSRSNQPCSPQALSSFNFSDQTELLSFGRQISGKSNMNADLWNTLPAFLPPPPPPPPSQQSNLNALFHSSTTAPCAPSTVASSCTDSNNLSNAFRTSTTKCNFAPSMLFNFADSESNGFSTGFASTNEVGCARANDMSPTYVVQYRSQPLSDTLNQHPLTRRHSDWVVSSTNPLLDLVTSQRSIGTGRQQLDTLSSCRAGFATEAQESHSNSFASPGGFDLLLTLDQLCLNSSSDELPVGVSLSTQVKPGCSQNNGLHDTISQCPPGFEPVSHFSSATEHAPFSSLNSGTDDLESGIETTRMSSIGCPWSATSNVKSNTLFLSSHSPDEQQTDYNAADSLCKTSSYFHRLFNQSSSDTNAVTDLNSIWSPPETNHKLHNSNIRHHHSNIPNNPDNQHSFTFPSHFDASNDDYGDISVGVGLYDCVRGGIGPSASSIEIHTSISNTSTRGCGTIGEGRRRRQDGQSPLLTTDIESIVPISIASSVASLAEVS